MSTTETDSQAKRQATLLRVVDNEILNGPTAPEIDDSFADYAEWSADGALEAGRDTLVFFPDSGPLPRYLVCLRDSEGQASFDLSESLTEATVRADGYAGTGDADDVFDCALPERIVDLEAAQAYRVQLVTHVDLIAPRPLD